MKGVSLFCLMCLFLFCSCSPQKEKGSTPSFPFERVGEVILLGHRGSGDDPSGERPPNSLEAVRYGLKELDGVEVDLQISKDSTLWVFHDHELKTCEGEALNMNALSDAVIKAASGCSYRGRPILFRGMLEALQGQASPEEKILSLDIKALKNPAALRRFGGKRALARLIVDRLRFLERTSTDLRYFIEIPFEEQLKPFEALSDELFYLIEAGDRAEKVQQVLQEHEVGLSAPLAFAEGHPDAFTGGELSSKNLQLWTINTGNELWKALGYDPLAVQTDKVRMMRLAERMDEEGARYHRWKVLGQYQVKGRYSTILEKELDQEGEGVFLDISFSSPSRFKAAELLLVASIGGKGDEERYWRSVRVRKGEQRVLRHVPCKKGEGPLKLYFWVRGSRMPTIKDLRIGIWKASPATPSEARHSSW